MVGQTINNTAVKILMLGVSLGAALALVAVGITQLVEFDYDIPVHFVMSLYYILFGIMWGLCELPIEALGKYFSFLKSYIGKGVFYLFLGTLTFDETIWWMILAALYLIGASVLCFVFVCVFRNEMVDGDAKASGSGEQEMPNRE